MIAFICIFIVPILAVYFFDYIDKKKKNFKNYIFEYSLFLVIINFVILLILTYIFKNNEHLLNMESFTNSFSVKYISISLVLSFVMPIIILYLSILIGYMRKNLKVEIYIENMKKKGSNNGKKKNQKNY